MAGLNLPGRKALPEIRASEVAECGLACMTMVARYHGHDLDLNGLRQRFPTSMAGASLGTLIEMADDLGFSTRPLRLEPEDLCDLQTPAILHWNMNHFVVLRKADRRGAIIHDPARGGVRVSREELADSFTGVALEITPATAFERISDRTDLRLPHLWDSVHGLGTSVAQVIGLSLALQVVVFVLPFQLQLTIDDGILRGDQSLLAVLALAFGGLIILQAGVELLRAWLLQVFSHLLSFQMVGNVVHHLMRLPSDWFEKRAIGDILSRVSSANAIQDILTRGIVAALLDGLMAVTAIVILFLYSPAMTAVVVASVFLSGLAAALLFPIIRRKNEAQMVERAREQTFLMESVRAATTIKVMGREAEREGAWRNLFASSVNASFSVGKHQITLTALQTAINGLQTVAIIYIGAVTIVEGGGLSIGMLIAFLSFRQTFTDRTNALINQAIQFKLIGLHLERLSDIVRTEREATSTATQAGLEIDGTLSAKGLGFRYGASDRMVIHNLDLEVRPGEFLAITGASGQGKTTLLKLLLGLQHPTEGQVCLQGRPATSALWRAWRDRVGLVAQEDRLLSGSVADNIAFFDPDLNMERVYKAARQARVEDEILAMPMQYRSLIGDMGSTLSGGQKQRVLLARALYRDPTVLILDEGTANLDVETERLLGDLIRNLPITRIIVAHRPALLALADRVLRLEGGRLVE